MRRRLLTLALIITLISSVFIVPAKAAELNSLAEIAAKSHIEPLGQQTDLNAYAKLSAQRASTLPSKFSSKDLGHTTAVRQQNSNTCWAYSTLASLETYLLKSGKNVSHFSPEHMNIWGSIHEDGNGWQRHNLATDGGYSYISMGYLTSRGGPLLESEFPEGSTKSDYASANKKYSPEYSVTEIKYINRDTPVNTIKSYVMQYGAVVANFNADTARYMNANTDSFYCSNSSIPTGQLYGHSVSIVGWDDSYSKTNFSSSYSKDTPSKNGAWLVKNSWGPYVNNSGGYFWISYEDVWMFHSIFGPSFAIAKVEAIDNNTKLYQNEIYGATTQFSCLTNKSQKPTDTITYMNVFDFTKDFAELDKVIFESTSYDSDYTVYYIPVKNGVPSDNTSTWTKLSTGVISYTGYICADIDNRTLPAGEGAIGITVDNTRTYNANKDKANYQYVSNSIGVSEWLGYSGNYYFKNQGKYGDSFIMWTENNQTQFCDIMEFYNTRLDDSLGGTPVIKALTVKTSDAPAITEPVIPTTPAESEPQETTTPAESEPFSLAVNLRQSKGNNFTLTSKASGGAGGYQYRVLINNSTVQDFSDTSMYSTQLTEDGEYNFVVFGRDKTGTMAKATISFTLTDGKVTVNSAPSGDPSENPTIPADGKTYIMGDIDRSGNLSIKDATLIRKTLVKATELDRVQGLLADVNESDSVNISDATLIQKHIAMYKTNSIVGKTVIIY